MEFNKYQSSLEELNISSYPQEVQDDFFDAINSIPYIHNLISPNRPYAKDAPRDEKGRAIMDLSNPYIVENANYFRPTALFYKEHKCLTKLIPNPNPNSEFGKWIRTEIDRIWNGMVRPSDGAYVTGDMYWYLNYCPIVQSKIRKGTKIADRVIDFPEFWEGVLWRSIYYETSRLNGKHSAEIAKRGASKSYYVSSILSKLFEVGENKDTCEKVRAMVTAYQKEYLVKDGTLNKFVEMIDFQEQFNIFPNYRIKNSLQDMYWKKGYTDVDTGIQKGTLNEVIGVSSKDDPDKVRGKRSSKIIIEEFGNFPKIVDTYRVLLPSVQEGDVVFGQIVAIGCVCAGTEVYTKSGKKVLIEDLKQEDGILGYDMQHDALSKENISYMTLPAYKPCVEIKTKNRILRCSVDHPIYTRTTHSKRLEDYKIGNKREFFYNYSFINAGELSSKNNMAVVVCDAPLLNFGNKELFDPYFVGLLIGDGSYGFDKTPVLSNCDDIILNYVKKNYETTVEKQQYTKDNKLYQELRIKGVCKNLREIGIYGQTKTNKRLPVDYNNLSLDSAAKMLAGLFDTDGTIFVNNKKRSIGLTSSSEDMLQQVKELLHKFGIKASITRTKAKIQPNRKDKNDWYNLNIHGRGNFIRFKKYIPIQVDYKINNLNEICKLCKNQYYYTDNTHLEKIISVENIGVQRIYNLTADSTHTYLANDIITHNTGGSEGADFAGAQEIIYNPEGFNIQAVTNVYDKSQQGKTKSIFFFGAPINRKGCYNEDGISDITKAVLEIVYNRFIVKYNTTDPMALTRTKAENPLTLQEAIMRRDSSIFPVASIMDRIGELEGNPTEYQDVYVGTLVQKTNNEIEFKPTSTLPIRHFPHKDNKLEGAIEIFTMPEKDKNGKVFNDRYIAGCDPFDNDVSATMSLGSIFIMDLWTDQIVAEYTGRPMFADDFYEMCRLLCLFYNARLNFENNIKGLFSYFSKMNCLYMLTDTLEFLKDKQMIKGALFGNTAKGTRATVPINNYARILIRNWLLLPRIEVKKIDGVDQEVTVPQLTKIRNLALLKELSQWNPDGNFDRVSALGMLMLLREDRLILCGGNVEQKKLNNDVKSIIEDPFFEENYTQ